MTKKELGYLLMETKSNARVKLTDSLPFIRRLSPEKMEAIENGTYNYYLSDAFLYLNMCGATLDIFWDNIGSIKELRERLLEKPGAIAPGFSNESLLRIMNVGL